ncbi:40S ribosomal protein S6-like [Culex pipiens pallens]|uniref:40S ribosomal protein S6-like n=1 Tax=Culex pipiens pallens TaxID=42434 RepID=UPI001952DEED|nr:40S ribosomal protein S6-like [Culex pipiens pallens]
MLREGEKDIPRLTDTTMPRRLGPKRATNIRKLYNLTMFVEKRPLPEKDGKKTKSNSAKIQRLITPGVLQRKSSRLASKRVAMSRVQVYKGAGPAPSERICRRIRLSSMRELRSSVESEKEKNKAVVKAAKKVTEVAKSAKKSEAGKKAVTGEGKEDLEEGRSGRNLVLRFL